MSPTESISTDFQGGRQRWADATECGAQAAGLSTGAKRRLSDLESLRASKVALETRGVKARGEGASETIWTHFHIFISPILFLRF